MRFLHVDILFLLVKLIYVGFSLLQEEYQVQHLIHKQLGNANFLVTEATHSSNQNVKCAFIMSSH